MENLHLYNQVRAVPQDALKKIEGGRLKNMSDINPMWRIKTLTEQFGPCGIGWYYEITRQWLEPGANGEIAGFCNINLYVKTDDGWGKPIQGTGGSAFIAKEAKGPYTSDEVFKMALTDAISVACKALGFGADVYWAKDRTKYDLQTEIAKAETTSASKTVERKAENKAEEKKPEVKQSASNKVEPMASTELTEECISAMVLDIMNSNNIEEITNKWNLYKVHDAATGKKITDAVVKRRRELGV